MAANGQATPTSVPLHERMEARGAKKHRRKSDLARFMIERAAEMHRLVEVERYSWKDITAMLSEEEELTDNNGNPLTETVARITWSRVKASRRTKARPARPASRPDAQVQSPEELQIVHAPFAAPSAGSMQIDIRPVSLRRSGDDAASASHKSQQIQGVTFLDGPEGRPPNDKPAAGLGHRTVPLPEIL